MTTSRRQTREKVLQVLYAHEMTQDPIEKIKSDLLSELVEEDNIKFSGQLIKHVLENKIRYDELIKSAVSNWDIERIALLDFIIIKMCLSEFIFFEEIPPKVSINEAIDLAKDYSTRNSGKFVNGILDTLLSRLTKDGTIVKSGKGLISQSVKPANQ